MQSMTSKIFIAILFTTLLLGCGDSKNNEPKQSKDPETVAIPVDSLRTILEEMHDRDQGIRKELSESRNNAQDMYTIIQKMNTIDSLNQKQVKIILEKYGWLESSSVGEKASGAIFYVVQHAPLEYMETYHPQLVALASKGEAKKHHAAMMQDRILMYNNKKQRYGTQASNLVREGEAMVMWPVEDPENVNTRREEAGFSETIEDTAAGMNAEYDPNENLPTRNPW